MTTLARISRRSLERDAGPLKVHRTDGTIEEVHRDPHSAAHSLEQFLAKTLRELKRIKLDTLLERRYDKFRNMGRLGIEFVDTSSNNAGR